MNDVKREVDFFDHMFSGESFPPEDHVEEISFNNWVNWASQIQGFEIVYLATAGVEMGPAFVFRRTKGKIVIPPLNLHEYYEGMPPTRVYSR